MIDLESKRESLKQRIQNGDTNFTSEDITLFKYYPELSREYFEKVKEDYNYINELTDDYVASGIYENNFNFSNQEKKDICRSLILYELYKSTRFKTDYTIRIASFLSLTEEDVNELSEVWKKAFADPNFTFEFLDINDEVINLLLDYKRYDILAQLKPDEKAYIVGLSPETIDRLEKEFPVDKYPFPSKIIERVYYERPTEIEELKKEEFYKIRSFSDLIGRCSWLNSFVVNAENLEDEQAKKETLEQLEKVKERLVDIIFDIIKKSPSLAEYSEDYRISNIEELIPEERKMEYYRLLFEKECYRDSFSLTNNPEGQKLIMAHIKDIMSKNGHIHPKLFNALYNDNTNDELIDYLIDNGQMDCLFSAYSFNSPLKEDPFALELNPKELARVNRIIQNIKNLNPKYLPYIESIEYDYSDFPEILQAILATGRVKKIRLASFGYNETIKEITFNYIRNHPEVELTNIPYEPDEELISLFIEMNKVDRLIEATYNGSIYNSPVLQEYLNNNLTDLAIAVRVIHSLDIDNLQHERMWDFILSNELITSFFIKKINEDPQNNFADIYTVETAKRFLDFFIYKYKINPDHYIRMAEKFGGNIIRYIANENLQKIINLNDEEFEKILNIFPDTTFEMVDVEAAYDSIIQQMFSEKHPVIIDLYASFVQALDNNNQELINKLKEIIIINTTTDFLIKTVEKYKLPNTEDTEVLLNFIVSEYKKGNKDYAKSILHDLTNDIILNKRKEYRNGHHFAELYPNDAKIFENLLKAIEENNQEKIVEIVSTIIPYLNKGFYKKFKANKDIPEEYEDPKVLLVKLIEKVKDPSKRNKYLPMLKEITDYYIYRKQEEHHTELEIGAELSLPYELEERSSQNALVKFIIRHADEFEIHNREYNPYDFGKRFNLKEVIREKLMELGMGYYEVTEAFNYLENPKYVAEDRLKIAQANIPKLIKTANKIINENMQQLYWTTKLMDVIPSGKEEILKVMDEKNEVARRYTKPEVNFAIYQLLSELNIDIIRKSILNNEVVYQKLISVMKKRKLTNLPDCLKELIKQANISNDYINLASFISFFATILEEEEQRLNAAGKNPDEALSSLAQILKKAEAFSSLSSVYSQVLGPEDARLVKSNPPDNAAHAKTENNQRLNEAVELTLKNFRRQEVTVPPFDQDITIDTENGPKIINVAVGNFTHPANITMGERTGACMRIGGAGETLFNFCLGNKNGFHIRFEDPETHEFISRISGFRNGNTVFLNQLRHSVLPKKYTDEDLIKFSQEVARILIELSKNSPCPIDNVVINGSYAMENTSLPHLDLGVPNVKEGFPSFYSDVDSHAIVLATSAKDKPFVPVNLDKSRVPTYQPCRAKVQALTDTSKLMTKINRVYSVKKMLEGTKLEDLDSIRFPNGIIYGIVSDDWYIYVDRNYQVLYDVIDIDPRAKEELVTNLQIVEEMIAKKEIRTDEYGLR